jgi:GTP-binding protein
VTSLDASAPDATPSRAHAPRRVVIAVAGRPNVGKSTLVNRIVGRRAAIVEERPGVTRDRLNLEAEWAGRELTIVDTGGMQSGGDGLDQKVTDQAARAIRDADVVLVVTDASVGVTDEDVVVARLVRGVLHKVILVANKVDSEHRDADAWALSALGLGDPFPVSALHGRRVGDLLDEIVARVGNPDPAGQLAEGEEAVGEAPDELAPGESATGAGRRRPVAAGAKAAVGVAIVGRPNVGKSTLFNRIVGEDRSIVHDLPGTTRDAIDTLVETPDGPIRFIDTAGMRRKSRIGEGSEYYSFVRSLAAIDHSDIALLVLDAVEGVTHQEQRLAERIDAAGSPVILLLNKWELLDTDSRLELAIDVEDRLGFLQYAPVLRVSALTGLGVHKLMPAIRAAIEAYHRRIPTAPLNVAIRDAQSAHPAPGGARILYAVQGAVDPPTITLFATRRLPAPYLRFVERRLRERFDLGPTPLEMRVRIRTKR